MSDIPKCLHLLTQWDWLDTMFPQGMKEEQQYNNYNITTMADAENQFSFRCLRGHVHDINDTIGPRLILNNWIFSWGQKYVTPPEPTIISGETAKIRFNTDRTFRYFSSFLCGFQYRAGVIPINGSPSRFWFSGLEMGPDLKPTISNVAYWIGNRQVQMDVNRVDPFGHRFFLDSQDELEYQIDV